MHLDFSIVVPAHNEETLLPDTLLALRSAMDSVATLRGEIIVTDNDSNDRTAEIAKRAGARVISEKHRQIARARNAGAYHATGRYLIFVDADTQISARLLARTLEVLNSGEVCGGGTAIATQGIRPRWVQLVMRTVSIVMGKCQWACGAYVFCTRDAFLETGGFDERYFASEEIHFSRALKRWGSRRGMRFEILEDPIQTSMRKMEWYTVGQLTRMVVRTLLAPSRLRRQSTCELWYTRPSVEASVSQQRASSLRHR